MELRLREWEKKREPLLPLSISAPTAESVPEPPILMYCPDTLPFNWVDPSNTIRLARNISILFLLLQIIVGIAGIAYIIIIQKNKIYILFDGAALLLGIIGLIGALCMNKLLLMIHAFITSSFLGAFFVFQLLEALFLPFHKVQQVGGYQWNERTILLIFSLPYLLDFCIGIYILVFIEKINKEETANRIKQEEFEINSPLVSPNTQANSSQNLAIIYGNYDNYFLSRKCILCQTQVRNSIIYECGHRSCCYECVQNLLKQENSTCPLCEKPIVDVIKVLE